MLRFTRATGEIIDVALNVPNITLNLPLAQNATGTPFNEFRISVKDLPDGYELRSLNFGAVDLRSNSMLLPATNFNTALPVTTAVSAVLAAPSETPASGVKITGRIRGGSRRSIYISGKPGSVFEDGTFEFLGVPPGVHIIVSRDNPQGEHAEGAAIVVGAQSMSNLNLEEISEMPSATESAVSLSAANRPPGTRLPLHAIRGRIVDADTHLPLNAGRVVVNGNYASAVPLDTDGGFEISRLLPGKYTVEVFAFGIGTVSRTVVLEDQDADLDLSLN